MGEVNVESHNMGPTFSRLTFLSFHVNWPSHSWDTTFSKLALKIQGQGHGWGQSWRTQSGCNILSTHIHFITCQSTISFLSFKILWVWPWNSKVKVIAQGHKQGSDQFISFNSIQFQFKLDSGFFNSIQFQFKSDSVSFNSIPIPIHFLSIPIQFNSNVMHRNKQINQIIGYFKFNLNISLFAAQFRKYIIQDHNNSRINKSALVQVLG